jgi:hypothetical protein
MPTLDLPQASSLPLAGLEGFGSADNTGSYAGAVNHGIVAVSGHGPMQLNMVIE